MSRTHEQLRPVRIQRGFTRQAPGSVLYQAGGTTVLCTASVEAAVPAWLAGQGKGWITAEYNMLPGSTQPRKRRERGGNLDGRTTEIQRLIGRSLRAVADLNALGERLITVDCDVLDADGGTRTASITGGFLALLDAVHGLQDLLPGPDFPLRDSVAAVSVALLGDQPVLDPDHQQDFAASVDMNVVMTGQGRFVEIQGSGEEATFDDGQLQAILRLARQGAAQLNALQRTAFGPDWPWPAEAEKH